MENPNVESTATEDAESSQKEQRASLRRRPRSNVRKSTGAEASRIVSTINDNLQKTTDKKRITKGNMSHYSGEELNRSPYFPTRYRSVLIAFVVIAIVIGALIFYEIFDMSVGKSTRNEQKINSVLDEQIDYEIPKLSDIVGGEKNIDAFCANKGYTYSTITPDGSTGVYLFKYSSNMSKEVGEELVKKDINTLSAADATQLLYGSWQLDADSTSKYTVHIKYYDYKSGGLEAAIQKCIFDQGCNSSEVKEQGVDDSGNTYKMGYIDIGEESYEWRVSAIAAEKVYKTRFPENTIIVGFRLTERA